MAKIIEVSQLNYAYPVEEDRMPVPALRDVSLEIEEGEFVAVLGHNGCGKSTLAKHLNGILKADSGKVTVLGMDASDDGNIMEIRRNVGMVFQNPDNQLIATVVDEDVAFALENLGVPYDEMVRRVDEALEAVSMTKYRLHSTYHLSGGQKQRIAIAGVLAMQPQYLVLDEPTAMLDPKGRAQVLKTLIGLKQRLGLGIVLITHYMDEAAMADRVVVMDKGKVVMDGTHREVFANDRKLVQLGLDVPDSTQLYFALTRKGVQLGEVAINEEEIVLQLEEKLGNC
jgi:energy-coupling factor transport system ATP-binding protein